MKKVAPIVLFLLLCAPSRAVAHSGRTDSLRLVLSQASHDSVRINTCWELYNAYEETNRDSARYFMEEGLKLARKNGKKLAEARCLISNAYLQLSTGLYVESLENLLQAQSIIESHGEEKDNWLSAWSNTPENAGLVAMAYTHHTFANLMTPTMDTAQQIAHYREAMRLGKAAGNTQRVLLANLGLGRTYLDNNLIDSALVFESEASRLAETHTLTRFIPAIQSYLGAIYLKKNQPGLALQQLHKGVRAGIEYGVRSGLTQNYFRLAKYYLDVGNKDSALFYSRLFTKAMETVGAVSLSTVELGTAYEYLFRAFQMNKQADSAFHYQGLALATKDSISNARINSLAAFQQLALREQLRVRDIEKEQALYESRVRNYGLLAGLVVFSLIALMLYRNNRQKHRANAVLQQALTDLKSTQAQLIQSEKMASLGELTAGIAHEIQNPLNFVNNFSELSQELVDELKTAVSDSDYQTVADIAGDIKGNLEKINHHGKRADAIVKGMLQHSRSSSGQKEQTDINALCDEYLRLAYQGLRAKDNSFHARVITDFDPAAGRISAVPPDIGRVMLNLLNNAFYAVHEKAKKNNEGFEPLVTMSTKRLNNNIKIIVNDNGTGIPESIKDKIFQPFFTTKPTGMGTGLGLSLSYDIIKAHGGAITVESTEGEGTTFTVLLPAYP